MIQTYLSLAVIAVRTVEYSTTEVTSTWLLPEMVLRVANMLNYFLQFLTGTHKHACNSNSMLSKGNRKIYK